LWWRYLAFSFDSVIPLSPGLLLVSTGPSWSPTELLLAGAAAALGAAYFIGLEGGSRGQTLGKRWVGICVVDVELRGPIGLRRAAVRHAGRLVAQVPAALVPSSLWPSSHLLALAALAPMLAGHLWMLCNRERQTVYDRLAHTLVVYEFAYPLR